MYREGIERRVLGGYRWWRGSIQLVSGQASFRRRSGRSCFWTFLGREGSAVRICVRDGYSMRPSIVKTSSILVGMTSSRGGTEFSERLEICK